MTGRFRKRRGGEILKPIGDWPENWLDSIHEFDGHGVREGETILKSELDSLYLQNEIEGAVDDVTGATLDPDMVWAGRDVEMGFFKTRLCSRTPIRAARDWRQDNCDAVGWCESMQFRQSKES